MRLHFYASGLLNFIALLCLILGLLSLQAFFLYLVLSIFNYIIFLRRSDGEQHNLRVERSSIEESKVSQKLEIAEPRTFMDRAMSAMTFGTPAVYGFGIMAFMQPGFMKIASSLAIICAFSLFMIVLARAVAINSRYSSSVFWYVNILVFYPLCLWLFFVQWLRKQK